jgi:hypothetical protein
MRIANTADYRKRVFEGSSDVGFYVFVELPWELM